MLPKWALLGDLMPASAGVVAAGVGGQAFAIPPYLTAVGQALVVAVFVLRGIDKRMAAMTGAVERMSGELQTLHGRIDGLKCQGGKGACSVTCNLPASSTGTGS